MNIVRTYYVDINRLEDSLEIKMNPVIKLDVGEEICEGFEFPPLRVVKRFSRRLRQRDVFPACHNALFQLSDETNEIIAMLKRSSRIEDNLKVAYYIERDIRKVEDHETRHLLRLAIYGTEEGDN